MGLLPALVFSLFPTLRCSKGVSNVVKLLILVELQKEVELLSSG